VSAGVAERKIGKIETFYVPPRWLFVRVESDDGAFGWGEASLEGWAEAVDGAFEPFRDRFIGADPFRIEDIWQVGHRGGFYRSGAVLMSALSGLEQALWDLKGRVLGLPAWQMLGGKVRDKVRFYAWIGGDRPHEIAAAAEVRKNQGFNAVKMNATAELGWIGTPKLFDEVVKRVEAAQAVGMDVGLDFHGRVHRPLAKQLAKALEPLGLLFIEEPLLSENPEGLAEFAAHTTTPIALGERLYSRWDFKPLFESRAVDIIQPDLSHAGGILEVRKIAADGRSVRYRSRAALPAGPAGARRVPTDRRLHAQPCDPGNQPRHPLQYRRARPPQLLHQQGGVDAAGRLSAGAGGAGPWCRDRRGRGARGGQGPAPLAQSRLADERWELRRVVTP
jgi:galactonate dehydratase